MTREEALHRVKGYLTDIIPVEDYSEVEEIIKALEQRWIPVSERLPEDENKDYLVCLDDGYIATIMYDGFGKWLIDDAEIIAWIPLPEPYTED